MSFENFKDGVRVFTSCLWIRFDKETKTDVHRGAKARLKTQGLCVAQRICRSPDGMIVHADSSRCKIVMSVHDRSWPSMFFLNFKLRASDSHATGARFESGSEGPKIKWRSQKPHGYYDVCDAARLLIS